MKRFEAGLRVGMIGMLVWFAVPCGLACADDGEPKAQDAPIAADRAAGAMTVPEGFHVTLFASEPDVRQPIALTIDAKGRLWVVECFSYPTWSQKPPGEDRILILEDTDGDGRFDVRKVFYDKGTNLSGIALGFGGVWACSTPNLVFIPDRDGDDVPDSEPEIKLDGWSLKAEHNVFNGLNWGPDGWLHGCNGILSDSLVGKPGTADSDRTSINCGVWRYHPTRAIFEVVAHGTTNPWGLDFDDYGEMFITNCVIPHVYRVVPGAHFQRMFGQDLNPYVFGLIGSIADHVHWNTIETWSDIRTLGVTPTTDRAGGGHAHAGGMIYLGDNWPDEYRGSLFLNNIHGHRVNHDKLHREGARYTARHQNDFLLANDPWFRGLELKYGPDGGVYLIDWSDTGECHEADADGAHRENGRIYKVTYGAPRPTRVDLSRADDATLVQYQNHKNDWYVRTARRVLQERAAAGQDLSEARDALWRQFEDQADPTRKLRALWALHVIGGASEDKLIRLLMHDNEVVRAWAVRLLSEQTPSQITLEKLATLAAGESSAAVRLALASALQRIPVAERWSIASHLLTHGEDTSDPYIPLLLWYGIEPLVASDATRAGELAMESRIPLVRAYAARRMLVSDPRAGVATLLPLLKRGDDSVRSELLDGMLEALRGHRGLQLPEGWSELAGQFGMSPSASVRSKARLLSLWFGDTAAVGTLTKLAEDPRAETSDREQALQALIEQRVRGLAEVMHRMLADPTMRAASIRGLAAYDDKTTPTVLLRNYRSLNESERADAVGTLAARPEYAARLIDAIEDGTVDRRDVSAAIARQISAFKDEMLVDRFQRVWGRSRPTSTEVARLVAEYKTVLTPARIEAANASKGRDLFNRTCARCHKLYSTGGDVGPELTGSDRRNLDYLLQNILDPSSTVGRDFQLTLVVTSDGRLISGIIREQDEKRLVIQTENEKLVVNRADIEEMKSLPASMMPEGLFERLKEDEIADLVSYLSTATQVPLPSSDPK